MDAITLLKDDHKATEKLLARYEKAGDRAFVTKRDAVADLVAQLTPTLAVTEQLFVPVTLDTVDDVGDVALECAERARILTWQLAEVAGMDPTEERFDARVAVLADAARTYRHAVEDRYYPKVRDALGRNALGELGDAMATVKEVAPTHPHPRRSGSPIADFVTGTAAGGCTEPPSRVRVPIVSCASTAPSPFASMPVTRARLTVVSSSARDISWSRKGSVINRTFSAVRSIL